MSALYSLADRLHNPCRYLLDTVHRNMGAYCGRSLVRMDRDNVKLLLLKRQEEGVGLILRLLETDGMDCVAELSLDGRVFSIPMPHNAIETYLYSAGEMKHCDLLEE